MQINRGENQAPRVEQVTARAAHLQDACVGCTECTGLCLALIDAMVLPDLILSRAALR